jgi:thiosulfate dehydrogenase
MSNDQQHTDLSRLLRVINYLIGLVFLLVLAVMLTPILVWKGERIVDFFKSKPTEEKITSNSSIDTVNYWRPKYISAIEDKSQKELVEYGKELIAHTSRYLGPKGSVMQLSNGLNCQNCHLDAGTKIWGNNYGSVASTYPKFRARSGMEENMYKRINDCF